MTDIIFADGTHEKTVAFRVDNPSRKGCKMIVCGVCVDEHKVFDARTTAGHLHCEFCGGKFGQETAHNRAIGLSAINAH